MLLALGVLLRSTAGAITTALALMWAPMVFGALLPQWAQENVLRYLPTTAVDSLVGGLPEGSPLYLAPWAAALLAAAWPAVALGAAFAVQARRDA
ncbi:hypothetical protein [Nocardiopsis ansamitocini]|uniref:ABC transporter permease n=1 Tax=Nocardiopsis ansamitocini TaxID=1670832 RepID=A0A9W6P273_9ACTN|nr:hypothetical protein Nans01_00980 [Nocardiopsis ansamitocini]